MVEAASASPSFALPREWAKTRYWRVPMAMGSKVSGVRSVRIPPSPAASRRASRRKERVQATRFLKRLAADPGRAKVNWSENIRLAMPAWRPTVLARARNRSRIRSSARPERSGKVWRISSSTRRATASRISSRLAKWRNGAPALTPNSAASAVVVRAAMPSLPMILRAASAISMRLGVSWRGGPAMMEKVSKNLLPARPDAGVREESRLPVRSPG